MRIFNILLITILWVSFNAHAQNKQVLYDFTDIPQSLMVNPGVDIDFKWYAGIPGLSGASVQMGSNGISVYDLFADDGRNINDKFREKALMGMKINDELSGTYQLEILNGGFVGKDPNVFYSFGIYNEGDAIGYWFKDYAILAFEGNADKLNERFDLSHLKTRGEMVNVFHFGINKRLGGSLTLGARAKVYSSVFDFNSTQNKGYFVTTEGQNNLLANSLNADMQLRTSGLNEIEDAIDDENIPGALIKRSFFGGNLGLGVDVGFTYQLNDQTVVTGSLLDLGFIYHTNDVKNYTLNGSTTVEGVEIILPDALSDPNRDFWQDLVDEVEALVPFEDNTKSYLAFRPTKLNTSIRYNFGEQLKNRQDCECSTSVISSNRGNRYLNGVGAQLYMVNRPRGPQTALTAFYLRRLGNAMTIKTTYTVDKFTMTNLGAGVSFQMGPVNFYLMADNLLAYKNLADTHYASFQFGLNIISWGK